MLRFIMQLLGREYEPCRCCEVLKEQLEIERINNRELIGAIVGRPRSLEPMQTQSPARGMAEIPRTYVVPSRQRAELERADAAKASAESRSLHIAKPDNPSQKDAINKLEEKLGISKEN